MKRSPLAVRIGVVALSLTLMVGFIAYRILTARGEVDNGPSRSVAAEAAVGDDAAAVEATEVNSTGEPEFHQFFSGSKSGYIVQPGQTPREALDEIKRNAEKARERDAPPEGDEPPADEPDGEQE